MFRSLLFKPKINVAIDFGTDGTSIAYSIPNRNHVYIYGEWRVFDENKDNTETNKLRTTILLDRNGSLMAYGLNAFKRFVDPWDLYIINWINNKYSYGGVVAKQIPNHYLFDHFKMHLYRMLNDMLIYCKYIIIKRVYLYIRTDNDGNGKYKQGLRKTLTAMNGKEMDSEIVFTQAFEFLKDEVMENLMHSFEDRQIEINITRIQDIQWIVTIPAIWDDSAKNKMIKWIEMAGLIDKNIKDHCILKYEPDCASLSLQYEILKNRVNQTESKENNSSIKPSQNDIKEDVGSTPLISEHDSKLFDDENKDNIDYLKGKKYILIDAGGGTVDIACHEFMDNFGVKELYYPTGGPWGDMYVDKAFIDILHHLLGHTYIIQQDIKTNKYCNYITKYRKRNDSNKFKYIITNILGNNTFENIAKKHDNVYLDILESKIKEKDIDLLKLLFGCWILEKIKMKGRHAYFDLMKNFRFTKIGFKDSGDDEILKIKIPKQFLFGIDREIRKSKQKVAKILNDIVSKYEYKTFKNCFKYTNDTLQIHNSVWKQCLYDPLIKEVTDHLKGLLNKKIMQPCSYIYLVGGYTKTVYFQNKIIAMFGKNTKYNIDIIIPEKQLLCVVDGAARMGLLKNSNRVYVRSRILSKTYGQLMDRPLENIENSKRNYKDSYIQKNIKFEGEGDERKAWVKDCFKIFARIGDCIPHDYKFEFYGVRKGTNCKIIRNAIYSSDMENPLTKDDGKELCEYEIKWPDNDNSVDITNIVTFGELLKIESYPKNLPNKKFNIVRKYVWK